MSRSLSYWSEQIFVKYHLVLHARKQPISIIPNYCQKYRNLTDFPHSHILYFELYSAVRVQQFTNSGIARLLNGLLIG